MFVGTGTPHKPLERAAARELRTQGWSYKKIAAELGVSVASVFNWSRDIELTEEQINFNQGRGIPADSEVVNRRARSWVLKNQERRLAFQDEGRRRAIESDALHEAGCMLYWAEGAKHKNTVTFCNSDLHMIKFFLRFLRYSFGLQSDDFTLRLNVYLGNGLTVQQIEDHWLEGLGLPRSCLRAHQIDHFPTSSSGKKKTLPYGVCSLRVKRSTWVAQHIFGAIQEYGGFEEPKWLG